MSAHQQPTQIHVMYFGGLRERLAGNREETLTVPPGTSVGQLVERICELHPRLVGVLDSVRLAINDDLAQPADQLKDGDIVALIPPVAGGAPATIQLTDQPLDVNEVLGAVVGPSQGGIVLFIGVVRSENNGKVVRRLEYEAYPSMAMKVLRGIVDRCETTSPGVRLAVAHRTGTLTVGEIAVIVAASAPHRVSAFAAAQMCMDLIKVEVPIWKKEFSPDGSEWIGLEASVSGEVASLSGTSGPPSQGI